MRAATIGEPLDALICRAARRPRRERDLPSIRSGETARRADHRLRRDADPKVSEGELRQWHEHTSAGFTAHLLPGGHFFVQSSLPALVDLMLADLTAS